jgi:hypothetical protein
MDAFIADLEKDRMDSAALMPIWREMQKENALKLISDLQIRVEQLTNNLQINDPPADARTKLKIQQEIRTLNFRIKLQNDKLIKDQKINENLDAEWENRVQKIDSEDRMQYYAKLTQSVPPGSLRTPSPIHIIQNVKSMDELQGKDKNMTEYMNAVGINKDNYYNDFFTILKGSVLTQYEDECLAFQLGNPREGNMEQRTPEMDHSIQRVFNKILPVREDFYVFRCYYSSVSIDDINKQRRLGRHTSTSLSYEYSYGWGCADRKQYDAILNSDTGSIMICIIIPKGSKVVPLNYYAQNEEYEILLSAEGKLHYTGDIHPDYKIPIFIYFDSYAKMKHHYKSKVTPRTNNLSKSYLRKHSIKKSNSTSRVIRKRPNSKSLTYKDSSSTTHALPTA